MIQSLTSGGVLTPLVYIRRLIMTMAIATLFLMALGSATRVMNAGLSCPDWPLCYGEFVPTEQMNLQVFLEWFHRLVASSIGFATLILAGSTWWYRKSLPQWLPWFGLVALILVIIQGALGAFTVTELLRFDIVTAHLGAGLLFFSTLTAGASALADYNPTNSSGKLAWLSLSTAIAIYAQSILGGLVASQWALHQCLANSSRLCTVMNNHLFGVIPVCTLVLAVGIWCWYSKSLDSLSKKLGLVGVGFLGLQVAIGFATYRMHLQIEPLTVAHQSVGALLLGSMIVLTVLGFRSHNCSSLVAPIKLQ
jgi:cytochrome c oxidase assembly protein subunit 15